MPNIAHMICHTHWDREWYLTREQFRLKLIRLIDGLLDIVENCPDYVSFMLDGQTIAIEDYLEIKPYNRERLHNALKSGKIVCGPWYVLPDELLISGEAHIRNFLQGVKVTRGVCEPMAIGYLPDSFGHPAQMPQILTGLGMDTAVFWRGVPNAVRQTEFIWRAPDGKSGVLCVHMRSGYGNCANLSDDIGETLPRIAELFATLNDSATTDVLLFMNGSDHVTAQTNIVKVVDKLNHALNGDAIRLSTLDTFVASLKARLGNAPSLQNITGEMRSGERSMLLGGTLSTRMYLKQANDAAQTLMERYIEPLLSAEILLNGHFDSVGMRDYIWKRILSNQPHDSICGCSIDPVHREMVARYESLNLLQNAFFDDAALRMGESDATRDAAAHILLFEPNQDMQPSMMIVDVDLNSVLVEEVDYAKSIIANYEPTIVHPDPPQNVTVRLSGETLSCAVLSSTKDYRTLYQDHTLPEKYKVNRVSLAIKLPGICPGLHALTVESSCGEAAHVAVCDQPIIENAYYKIVFSGGAFDVTDKLCGITHTGVHQLIDGGDAGDEYTYSWPEHDNLIMFDDAQAHIAAQRVGDFAQTLTVSGAMRLPVGLTPARTMRSCEMVDCAVVITVTLIEDARHIAFETRFVNRASDHRLVAQFPSGIKSDCSLGYNAFALTRRPIAVVVPDTYMEYPQLTHPNHGFVRLEDDSGYGLSVEPQGLPEFEAVNAPDAMVNLTLLRAVGWLSRTDLITRKGNGGWTIETPDAQMKDREHVFKCAISFGERDFGSMEKTRLPTRAFALPGGVRGTVIANNPMAFLKELPHDVRISALKPAEDGTGVILRLFSIAGEERHLSLTLPKSVVEAHVCDLAEKNLHSLDLSQQRAILTVHPAEILSVRFTVGVALGLIDIR